MGWKIGVIVFDSRQRHYRVQIGSVVHPASYPMGAGVSFPGGKAAEA
jgi:hypothetical protein